MRAEVLAHKLEAREERNPEQAWNLRRWPSGITEHGLHRLFVAVEGAWRGSFRLSGDALFNAADTSAPFSLLFDTRTWTPIPRAPAPRFRGFTYNVPQTPQPERSPTPTP
jgi:hypothetical protein